METEASMKKKRKRTDEKENPAHKKKRKFSTQPENEANGEVGPKIINVLAKKSSIKVKSQKKPSNKSGNDDPKNVSQENAKKTKKKRKKRKKKKAKLGDENTNGDDKKEVLDEEGNPIKKVKKRKKTKAEKMGEAIANGSAAEKTVHETPSQNKATAYLDAWKNSRSEWKFNKCTQIWLLQNAYSDSKIPDKQFDVLLEYMTTIKGGMKDVALERARKIVDIETKWKELEGSKTIDEIHKEVGELRPSEKKVDRAKEINIMLSEDK